MVERINMKWNRRQFIASSLAAAGAFRAPASAQDPPKATPDAPSVSLRGRVVCLTEELRDRYQITPECDARGHVHSLKLADGKLHPFLPTDSAAAVWMDERYRTRDLQVSARRFPQTSYIEVIKFQSWSGGKLHDLYYFCDICNITVYKPGPCDCCQEPVEFRETLADDGK